jgi:hypothetical protein
MNTPLQLLCTVGAVFTYTTSCEEVYWSHLYVVGWGVIFGKVIPMISGTTAPLDSKLALGNTILNPIKSPVHCLGLLEFCWFVSKAVCGGVVGYDGGWAWL